MSSNFEALIAAYVGGHQEIEDAGQTLIAESVETAAGVQLDALGRIVGELRAGDDDATYRRRVRARIATNRSSGTPRQLVRILRLLLGDAYSAVSGGVVAYENQGRAACALTVHGLAVPAALADLCVRFLVDGADAGVGAILITNPAALATWARFDESTFDTGATFFAARRAPHA